MNELTLSFPSQFPIKQSKRMVGALVRGEFIDYVADFYRSLRDGDTALPAVPIEPLRMSGDDDHIWIGLAP